MNKRIIISGGGTGGHIFPAISIAHEIRKREAGADVLFVGAKGGMEMTVVPKHNYPIEAVWISGIQRRLTLRNILRNALFPIKLVVSQLQSANILSRFQPDVVVGVGGYASGPLGKVAGRRNIPLVLCEQNAYPGLTNRWLAPKAAKILLGNQDAAKYFDAGKIRVTGNPIRSFSLSDRNEAVRSLGLDPAKPVLLSLGGSLGAQSLNEAIAGKLQMLQEAGIQLIWQCGKFYFEDLKARIPEASGLILTAFIDEMNTVYSAADLVISRAGGSTISELIDLNLPAILVPSPNVAEDHQTKNARSLSDRQAAVLVLDSHASEQLIPEAIAVLNDPERLANIKEGIQKIEKHNAAEEIVDEIFSLITHKNLPDGRKTG